MSGKKLESPFGHVTQREWAGLIARGADLSHIAMYALLRVRADRDGIARDSVPALMRQTNRSEDTTERLLKWLRDHGVMAQQRVSSRKGPQGLSWLYERRALPIDEWMESASMPPPPLNGVRNDAPSIKKVESANAGVGVRKSSSWSPQRLGDNPDVPPEKSQTGLAFPSGTREEDERLEKVLTILTGSRHAAAFTGKAFALADVLAQLPDKDAVQTAEAVARCEERIANGPAFFKSWLLKAADVEPPEREYTYDEIRHKMRLRGEGERCDAECSVCDAG